MGAGLRPTAKAVATPPDPTVGAPALYPAITRMVGGLTMASMSLQDLRRRLYVKAKADTQWRVWGLYVHVAKLETPRAAYDLAKQKDGAPGIDGVTFEAIEAARLEGFLAELRDELVALTYRPLRNRRVAIRKEDGKQVRILQIPAIRDRVVQGALKLILEPIFEADFHDGSSAIVRSGRRMTRWSGCGGPLRKARRR
jgi:hypothetical protein